MKWYALLVNDFILPFKNESELSFKIDRHDIQNTECRVDHFQKTEIVKVAESSTFQEEHKWLDVAFIAKCLDQKTQKLNSSSISSFEEKDLEHAEKLLKYFESLMITTNQILVACYESANKMNGDWLNVTTQF